MTVIQFDLFGEDEETTELNTILIETAEQLEALWTSGQQKPFLRNWTKRITMLTTLFNITHQGLNRPSLN